VTGEITKLTWKRNGEGEWELLDVGLDQIAAITYKERAEND